MKQREVLKTLSERGSGGRGRASWEGGVRPGSEACGVSADVCLPGLGAPGWSWDAAAG